MGLLNTQGTSGSLFRLLSNSSMECGMRNRTKYEIWVVALNTLVAVPVVLSVGFALVSGIIVF